LFAVLPQIIKKVSMSIYFNKMLSPNRFLEAQSPCFYKFPLFFLEIKTFVNIEKNGYWMVLEK